MPTWVHWTAPDGTIQLAGQLDEIGNLGLQRFSYAPSWLAGPGFPLGEGLPLHPGALLPPGGASQFSLFLDAGPDDWGRRVISRKVTPRPDTPTGFLLAAADETRQGALRFSADPTGPFLADGEPEPIDSLQELLAEVRAFQTDPNGPSPITRLLRAATSQGGYRPKATVQSSDGKIWIAKFPAETDRYDVETCEAAALHVARDAGLSVPNFRHLRVDTDRAILLVERFDRTTNGRLGYQSMRTAMRLATGEVTDYQSMAATAGYLCGNAGRRSIVSAAAFNIVVNNVDEHARNFGFLQDQRGQWLSSPLFDAVPVNHEQDGTPLEMGTPGRSLEQLLDLDWGLPKPLVVDIVTRVSDSARHLYEVATNQYGLDPEAAHNAERLRAAIAKV